jgi:hypothetical protein
VADIYLPGFERAPIDGRPGIVYDEPDDPKAVAHTTQGSSVEGAISAYRAYPPQLIVDPWRRRKLQHIPVNRGGYALWNEDADDSRCIQVEIVGFAEDAHTWPDEVLRWLGEEVARPLHEYAGVPYTVVWKGFKAAHQVNYALASASSPLRLTQAELDAFSGWLGHQHIPGDEHWDPGGLDVQRILDYARGARGRQGDMTTLFKHAGTGAWYEQHGPYVTGIDRKIAEATIADQRNSVCVMWLPHGEVMDRITKSEMALDAAVKALQLGGVDVGALAAGVAGHLSELLPDATADEIDERARQRLGVDEAGR